MTRSIIEAWGRLVKWPSKNDAHSWPRSDDRRTMRPTGRVEYGNNRVQEIVSGTHSRFASPDEKEELGADQERERAPEVIHLAPALAR